MTLPNKAVKQKSNQIEFRTCLLALPNQCVLSSIFSILIEKLNHLVPLCLSRQRHCQISSFSSDNWNLGETYWPFLLLILIVSCLYLLSNFHDCYFTCVSSSIFNTLHLGVICPVGQRKLPRLWSNLVHMAG